MITLTSVIQYAVIGLGAGAVYVLLVQGLIVIYNGTGVLNLAQASIAMLGAYCYNEFHSVDGMNLAVALAASVAICTGIGIVIQQLVMRRLTSASTLAKVVATLGLLVLIQGAVGLIWGTINVAPVSIFPLHTVTIGTVIIPLDRLYMVAIAIVLTAVLSYGYRSLPLGLAIRASAERPQAVAALGWSPSVMATVTWAVGSGLAAVAGILIAPLVGLGLDEFPLLVIPALAAGLIGAFTSFWVTCAAAIGMGIVQSEVTGVSTLPGLDWTVPFVVIVFYLMIRGKGLPSRATTSERLPALGTGAKHWPALVVAVAVTSYLLLQVFSSLLLGALIISFCWAIIMLSVVVLLGYTSQLSFEQMAMAGLATLVAARLVVAGVPFWGAAALGILAAVPIGVAFALPALRTRGINLAVVTLGLGIVVQELVLNNLSLVGGVQGSTVGSESLFGIRIDADRYPGRYALLCFAAFVICALALANIRRGKAGSALIAVRANERAAAALGINVLGTKAFAFVVGATFAAVGGILLGFRNPIIQFDNGDYNAFQSILVVAFAVVGGVGYAIGPVFGMGLAAGGFGGWLLYTLDPSTAAGSFWLVVAGGLAVMLTVTVHPDGAVHLALKRTMGLRRVTSRIALLRGRRAFVEPLSELDEHTAPPRTLYVRDVVVRFGQVTAVDGVSFSVAPGEIVGLIGPNGAGKTTVIDAITGFVRPTAGSISLDDETIGSRPAYRRVRAGISRSFQSLELFEDSTVRENLRVASDRRELWRYFLDAAAPGRRPLSAAAVSALREFGLQGEIDERVSELPYGHRRLLAVVRAVAVHPSLLLLDEPVAGLGSVEVGELAVTIRRLARKWGMGILVVEHDMAFVMNICDRLVVLDFGKCIAEGTPVEVQANPAVISAYLGDADPQTPSPRRARAVSDKSGQ